jgi:hypothetical protein
VPGPHGFARPRRHRSSNDTHRVHGIPPHVRDDAYAPLAGAGWREWIIQFRKTEAKYFSPRDWTGQISLNRLTNFDFSRKGFFAAQPLHGLDRLSASELSADLREAQRDAEPDSEADVVSEEKYNEKQDGRR